MPRHRSEASSDIIKCRFVQSAVTYPHLIVPTKAPFINLEMNEMGIGVLGRTMPYLQLSLQLKRHVCIALSYLDPCIVRRVRPLPGGVPQWTRKCAVMINSLENLIHINHLEELRLMTAHLRDTPGKGRTRRTMHGSR